MEFRLLVALRALARHVRDGICEHIAWDELSYGYRQCVDCEKIWRAKDGHPGQDPPEPPELTGALALIREIDAANAGPATQSIASTDPRPKTTTPVSIPAAELASLVTRVETLTRRVAMLEQAAIPEDGRG